MEWRSEAGLTWLQATLPGARVAFTTREGGASQRPFESLNLGTLTEDEPATVCENRSRLAAALGFPADRVLVSHQVHSAELVVHTEPQQPSPYAEPGSAIPKADGHIVAEPGMAALVFVADCLPVALAGPGGVAMLHCGWRGLAGGILSRGAEGIDATAAVIGPGIGPCCYEVGEDVLAAFADLEGVATGRHLDLSAVARNLLTRAGVERVESADICTSCEEGRFFSHRRDRGRTGRQAGLVWLDGG